MIFAGLMSRKLLDGVFCKVIPIRATAHWAFWKKALVAIVEYNVQTEPKILESFLELHACT